MFYFNSKYIHFCIWNVFISKWNNKADWRRGNRVALAYYYQ